MDRKKPVRHSVSSYKRKGRTVRSYNRGSGLANSKPARKVIKEHTKSEESRWENTRDNAFGVVWRSKENPDMSVTNPLMHFNGRLNTVIQRSKKYRETMP